MQYKIKCLGNWVYAKLPLRLHIYFPNIFLIWNDYNNLKVIETDTIIALSLLNFL